MCTFADCSRLLPRSAFVSVLRYWGHIQPQNYVQQVGVHTYIHINNAFVKDTRVYANAYNPSFKKILSDTFYFRRVSDVWWWQSTMHRQCCTITWLHMVFAWSKLQTRHTYNLFLVLVFFISIGWFIMHNSRAVARLMRDLKEIHDNPEAIPDIRAEPFASNMFIWHANIKAPAYCVWSITYNKSKF